jgi:hypothetical protein
MLNSRHVIFALAMMLHSAALPADVTIGIGTPHVSIGIDLPAYPELRIVPGYPVYYAPALDVNFFFFDGLYWVFHDDNWYVSFWYNGPWDLVQPVAVPLFILRIPVRYYRHPPPYFRGWAEDAPPRWSEHWGPEWERHRGGWDRWDRRDAPPAAPPPFYQREYRGDRYPNRAEQRRELRQRNYDYEPRDPDVRKHYQDWDRDRDRDRDKDRDDQGRGKGRDRDHGR